MRAPTFDWQHLLQDTQDDPVEAIVGTGRNATIKEVRKYKTHLSACLHDVPTRLITFIRRVVEFRTFKYITLDEGVSCIRICRLPSTAIYYIGDSGVKQVSTSPFLARLL